MRLFGIEFDRNEAILLLSAPVLLSLYYYHGSPEAFLRYFNLPMEDSGHSLWPVYWQFFLFFFLLGILPFSIIIWIFRDRPYAFGLGLGDWKKGLSTAVILIPLLILPLAWFAAQLPEVRAEYPLAKSLFSRGPLFWQYSLAYIVFYYITWEFYFRGFLLFGLAKAYGPAAAILIQTISSCLVHLGKPEGETLGSIVAGILFGLLALRTGSIWYGWLIHLSLGVLTDFFILHKAGVPLF